MATLYKMLVNEANPRLTDRTNAALSKLSGKIYHINNTSIIFHPPGSYYQLGIAEFVYRNNNRVKGLYTVYIKNNTVYVSLSSLDMVNVIDAPYKLFFDELRKIVTGEIPEMQMA
ncbi:hypothetical protein [Mucilaginibacter pedocola]|uniref:Uncharacterized protein n=1 Tax=Mucilaginibacter pedocola TaxID=1792845 RepID=A0A1S9PKZ2_9SPHI|nr:hypothetical protein [Mucilaginibacter pedocola]OOQ61621.1 hypothetical protein BC343_00665 [Mucilaginibacter pedocola]